MGEWKDMLDSELKFYLKTHLKRPTIDFKWSDEDNTNLFTYFDKTCEKECLLNIHNQLKIKQAFKEYFEPVGYILFKMNENQIRFKVFPYKVEPKDSINLSFVIKIIESNKHLIEYNYKEKKNQISIPSSLKALIYHFINNINNEEINKKELTRFAVAEFFKLQPQDIVLVRDEQIFVKILDDNYKNTVSENEKDTIANRYNGVNEEDLKSLYDDFFAKQENKNFFYYVAKLFVQIYLIDEKIDNIVYEKNIFSYIQSIIAEQIKNFNNQNDDFCTGFSGYIFRIHFKEVFGHIANFILIEIAASNEDMIHFLRYYSLGIVVQDGKKYKVPEIESENGLRWNVVSMLSIVKVYIKTKTSIDKAREKIDELNKSSQSLCVNDLPPLEYQNSITKEQEELEEQLFKDQKRVERVADLLDITKDEEKRSELRAEIQERKVQLQNIRDEKAKLKEKTVEKSTITKYNNLRIEHDTILRQLHREEKILTQNEKAYLSIKHALAKTLTSKKVLVN
jgi:hypothetical protein